MLVVGELGLVLACFVIAIAMIWVWATELTAFPERVCLCDLSRAGSPLPRDGAATMLNALLGRT